MVRTALLWRIAGDDLVGTVHVPPAGVAGERASPAPAAVLLLNTGPAPRSGNSDLSVRLGDRLAAQGIPVFRFDFCGLGDSPGSAPEALEAYWNAVVGGRNDSATEALIERIQREFGIARVFVGGVCAAALPSLRAASRGGASPFGLLLLEPDFRWTLEPAPGGASPTDPRGPFVMDANRLRRALSAVGIRGDSRVGRTTRPLRAWLQRLHAVWTGPRLPTDANGPLVACWQAGLARGIRSLVVVAEADKNDRYVTRILAAMPGELAAGVACVRVPGTNHLFTAGRGRDAVLEAVEHWVLAQCGRAPERAGAPRRPESAVSQPARLAESVPDSPVGARA